MAVAPKFEANISADISKFMRNMATVDKTIKNIASGVIVDIGADISNFMQRAATVQATAANIANNSPTVTIDANTSGFTAQATDVQSAIAAINSSDPTVSVNANTAGFLVQMAAVQATTSAVAGATPTVTVEANTAAATAQVVGFMATMQAITAPNLIVRLRASWANYQAVMGAMAAFSRNFSEITGMVGRGITIAMSPAIVPILASVVGLLGNLGPMLGTVAGSTFALGSAFATAGIGAAAFGAIAVTNLKGIFSASEELKKLDEKLAAADGWKERQAVMEEIKAVQGSLNAEQTKGLEAMNKLKETWSGIAGSLQAQTIQIFTTALGIMSGVLTDLKPLFSTVMDAAENLTESLGAAINAEPMQNFFNYLNTTAAPMFETISKAVGNFFQGFFSMMTAFGPLATETAGGFLKMSEGFATWAAGLGESKKFQSFVDYVSENMPKIRSIFSDAFQGITNMFAGFGGSSSDMMTSLQDLMERFKNFSSTISDNKGFQNFLDYIKTNGPVVVSAIGEIITLITNLGTAAAPMGEKMLGIIDGMTDFANSMLEAHPWLGKLAVGAVVLGGAFLAALPVLVGLNALLGGFITKMILATAKTIWAAGVQVAKWILMGTTATLNAIKVAAAWALSAGIAMATAVASTIASVVTVVAQWLLMGAQAAIHAAKVAAAWALSTGAAMATSVAKMIATSAIFVAKWVWMGAQALFAAARMAAAWFIALGPIGWVIAAVIALAVLIIANWDTIKKKTIEIFTAVKDWVVDKFKEIPEKVASEVAAFKNKLLAKWLEIKFQIVKTVNELKQKVTDYFSELAEKVTSKVQQLQNQAMAKWLELKVKTLIAVKEIKDKVTDFFTEIAEKVVSKVQQLENQAMAKWLELKFKTISAVQEMKNKVIDFFTQIKENISNKMTDVKASIQNKWEEAKTAAVAKISAMLSAVIAKFAEIATNVRNKMTEAKTALSNKWEEAKSATSSKLADLVSTVITFFAQVVSKVREKMGEAVRVLGEKVGEMPGKVLSFVGEMLSAGGDLVRGLIDGIKNMGGAAVEAISGVVGGVISKAKSLLDINSPSRVFSDFGAFISEGLAVGVESKESAAVRAVTSMASAMTDAFNPQFSTAGVNVGMASMDINRDLDGVGAQVRRDLNINASVNQPKESGGGGFQQTVIINSPTEISPAENARALRRVSQQQAMQWGLT